MHLALSYGLTHSKRGQLQSVPSPESVCGNELLQSARASPTTTQEPVTGIGVSLIAVPFSRGGAGNQCDSSEQAGAADHTEYAMTHHHAGSKQRTRHTILQQRFCFSRAGVEYICPAHSFRSLGPCRSWRE
jgi:hypothetical protein